MNVTWFLCEHSSPSSFLPVKGVISGCMFYGLIEKSQFSLAVTTVLTCPSTHLCNFISANTEGADFLDCLALTFLNTLSSEYLGPCAYEGDITSLAAWKMNPYSGANQILATRGNWAPIFFHWSGSCAKVRWWNNFLQENFKNQLPSLFVGSKMSKFANTIRTSWRSQMLDDLILIVRHKIHLLHRIGLSYDWLSRLPSSNSS